MTIGSGRLISIRVGFGGSCFPKDTAALLAMGRSTGCSMPLIQALREINADQPRRLIRRLEEILGSLEGKHIGLLGLTFKPHSDDLREAPSLTLSALALEKGAVVKAYDPLVRQYPLAEVQLASNPHQLMEACDAVLLVTEWEEFRQLDWGRLADRNRPLLFMDGRNMFSMEEIQERVRQYPFVYLSVGRPPIGMNLLVETQA